jgi:hypothetical protein
MFCATKFNSRADHLRTNYSASHVKYPVRDLNDQQQALAIQAFFPTPHIQ